MLIEKLKWIILIVSFPQMFVPAHFGGVKIGFTQNPAFTGDAVVLSCNIKDIRYSSYEIHNNAGVASINEDFRIKSMNESDEGLYWCIVKNKLGVEYRSGDAHLSFFEEQAFPKAQKMVVSSGDFVRLRIPSSANVACIAHSWAWVYQKMPGTPPLTIASSPSDISKPHKSTTELPGVSIEEDGSLVFNKVSMMDEGTYKLQCEGHDHPIRQNVARLVVVAKPTTSMTRPNSSITTVNAKPTTSVTRPNSSITTVNAKPTTSSITTVNGDGDLRVLTNMSSGDVKVKEGGLVTLQCSAQGDPPIKFTWEKDQKPLKSFTEKHDLYYSSFLLIQLKGVENFGKYICHVRNRFQNTTHEIWVRKDKGDESEGSGRNLTVPLLLVLVAISVSVNFYLCCTKTTLGRNVTGYAINTQAIYKLVRKPRSGDNNENEVGNIAGQTVREDDDHLLYIENETAQFNA